jgi:hypothetical protein
MKALMILSAAAMTATPVMAAVFTDSASFFAQLVPGSYTNDFTGLGGGPSPDLSFSSGGFSYTISTQAGAASGLFNDPGLVSTNNATDSILVSFTSGNVTAVGGNFWATNISVQPVAAQVAVTLSDGQTVTFNSTSAADFRGFTSGVTITSLTIDAIDPISGPAWSTLDNLTVGRVIPAPGAMAVLGLGGLLAARRRR